MHESTVNQAAGLMGLLRPSAPRMMAMVAHGDTKAELPLMWRLCWTLSEMGYPVTVLDATTFETDANPGLAHRLGDSYWHGGAATDAPAWDIIPAGRAIQAMCGTPSPRPQRHLALGQLFPRDTIVILYSRVEWLIPLICGFGVSPLLAVSPNRASLLSSYQALKRLLINGNIQPTIASMEPQSHEEADFTSNEVGVASLGECAKNFLGYDVNAVHIAATGDNLHDSADMQRLALRLVESAALLSTHSESVGQLVSSDHLLYLDRSVGSH
jgi:hypothetical protein